MKYRVINLNGSFEGTCPPRCVEFMFPTFAGETVNLSADEFTIEFQSEVTPVQIPGLIVQKLVLNEGTEEWVTV